MLVDTVLNLLSSAGVVFCLYHLVLAVRVYIAYGVRRDLLFEEAEWLKKHPEKFDGDFVRDEKDGKKFTSYWIARPWLTTQEFREMFKPVPHYYQRNRSKI